MKMHLLLVCLPLALGTACGDDNNSGPKDAGVHDAAVDGAPATPDASCFTNPTTNNEIINACTDAQKIFKDSHPPLLNADGTLPPLP